MDQSALFVHWAGCEQSYKSMKKMNRKERTSFLLPLLRCRTRHSATVGLLGELLEDPFGVRTLSAWYFKQVLCAGNSHKEPKISHWFSVCI